MARSNAVDDSIEKQLALLMVGALALLWLMAQLFRVVIV